jgi:glycosyltransferase involved in cell wall biosynthesis
MDKSWPSMKPSMKVALINNAHQDTGFGRYAFELHDCLIKSGIDADHYLFDRNSRSLEKASGRKLECIHKIRNNPIIDNALLMKLDRLPNLFFDYRLGKFIPRGYDIYHITNQNICDISYYDNLSTKIITVHDLIFYVYPTNYLKKLFSRLLYNGLNKSDCIISISEATKKDLTRHFKIPEWKIKVIHLGVSHRFRPMYPHELSSIYSKYALEQKYRYLLHVGNPEPRKNVITLLKAFHKLIKDFKLKDIRLLKINKFSKVDEKLIVELGLQDYVKVVNVVPEKDLISFYNIADIFVFPSFYEGFGFPPLEAMACGTPVITSNTSSIPEVVGDAGILLNAGDTDGFAAAICQVLSDDKLREEMRIKGLEKAREFNWEKTARETLEVYRNVTLNNALLQKNDVKV